jgi:hypothetical protein
MRVRREHKESTVPLTGKFSFRKALWGRIVLQVEEEVKPLWRRSNNPSPLKRRWRDATLMDLAAPEMRPLIDLRFKPHFRLQSQPAPEPIAVPNGASPDGLAQDPLPLIDGEPRRTAH